VIRPIVRTGDRRSLRARVGLISRPRFGSGTPGGDVDFINRQVLEYFGKTFDELKNWQTSDAVHPDDHDRVVTLWANTIANGQPYDVEYRLRRFDGMYRWFHARGRPLRDAEGAVARWYVLLTDIDERKQAEQRLKEQEAELRQMLDLTPQLVEVFGPTRERLYANRMALSYLGLTLDEWRQRGVGSDVHPEDAARLKAHAERSMLDGLPYEMEVRLRSADGTYRWFLARYNPVRDDNGQILRWYVGCTDIEDRKRAEERLQQENVGLRGN
jgi:PAS domain S-box-containing protein